jgi:hypothetical protein
MLLVIVMHSQYSGIEATGFPTNYGNNVSRSTVTLFVLAHHSIGRSDVSSLETIFAGVASSETDP